MTTEQERSGFGSLAGLFLNQAQIKQPIRRHEKSDDVELWELEKDGTLVLEATKTGNTEEMRKLFSKGLSPLWLMQKDVLLYTKLSHLYTSM